MKRKKIVGWILIISLVLLIGSAGYSFYKLSAEKLPTKEINEARESLTRAKKNDALKYATKKLKDAEMYYDQAMIEWALQNEQFFLFRDFSKTRELASKSLALSSDAKQQSVQEKNKMDLQLKADFEDVEKIIVKFDTFYKTLPLERETFDLFNKGKMEYLEAKNEFNKNNLVKAAQLIEQADSKLLKAEKSAKNKIENFFKSYPDWINNAKLADQLSKNGQVVVLVNKMESKCTVLKSGKAIKVFNAELGFNWMGDKIMKGDRSTPEGIYKITEKKKGVKTKYHKALLLNYPSKEDESRFARLKTNRVIPKSAQIGGLIEIHGDGGKGIHWTDGCIALKNKDMDQLYDLCSIGTPVIIIGSEKKLQEYFVE
ncbi:MAG: L,D-transpeptidase family protein [Prolixibacteraceae bacterium]|nr:L,D-transpeptidase family protein [Prolixibacteraceae bacterium]